MIWNLFPCKGDSSFGKSQKSQGTKSELWWGAESPGWFGVLPKALHETRCTLLWWSCQSPVAHRCSLLNHPNSFRRGMLKLNSKSNSDSLHYSLSHFECDGHTVHTLTPRCLPPPLTSIVKSSLFMHAHSSPLSLAARLHRSHANNSCYINSGWTSFWTDLIKLGLWDFRH